MNIPSSDGSKLACGRPLSLTPDSPELLHKIMTRLNAYVSEKDLNRSEAREKIVTTIVREARHFRVQDLLERLKSNYPEVGKATLYRNLPVLVESGILEAGPTDSEGAILYELSGDEHHDHIVCLDCDRIFEFHDESIEKQQTAVAKQHEFTLKKHTHVIYASCQYKNR